MANPTKTKIVQKLDHHVLLAWRERMGFSQRDACEALGCSRGAWAKWETDKSAKIPRYIGLACAALALGMETYGAIKSSAGE